ncbi:MAG: hypothetical protein ACRD2G_07065, partial [Terriglobia bacterium]
MDPHRRCGGTCCTPAAAACARLWRPALSLAAAVYTVPVACPCDPRHAWTLARGQNSSVETDFLRMTLDDDTSS